ncbi:uncharacterized protein LOC143297435 [Babylonia areolata]|uniref:uncharacterized protein LOC143297435 n=1 Tax=Babylonia areolata TaxID=304850 RepID=UPI003FD1AD83
MATVDTHYITPMRTSAVPTMVLEILASQFYCPSTTCTSQSRPTDLDTCHEFLTVGQQSASGHHKKSHVASEGHSKNNCTPGADEKDNENLAGSQPSTVCDCSCKTSRRRKSGTEEATVQTDDSCLNQEDSESEKERKSRTEEAAQQTDVSCFNQDNHESVKNPKTLGTPAEEEEEEEEERSAPVQGKQAEGSGASEANSSLPEEMVSRYRRLLVENRRLMKRKQCRECGQKAANITLLPCGHFVYCEDCAKELSHCGVCQRLILADVRTFLC